MSNDLNLAIPTLMEIDTPREDGRRCQPILNHNYMVVMGLMHMQTPRSDADGLSCFVSFLYDGNPLAFDDQLLTIPK